MSRRLAVVRQGKVVEVGDPHAGLIDVLLGVAEPRTLRMVGAVLRSAARIAAIEQGDVRLHFSRNPGSVRVWVTEAFTDH